MIDLAKMKADAETAYKWGYKEVPAGGWFGSADFRAHRMGASDSEHAANCSPQTILKLLAVVEAADLYYRRYCQEEAAEDGPFDTGCTLSQHEDALELRKVLAALESKTAMSGVQGVEL